MNFSVVIFLTDAADSLCNTEKNWKLQQNRPTAKTGQPQNHAELDDGDISTFIEEKRNRKKDKSWRKQFSKMDQNCERGKLELLTTDTTDWNEQSTWAFCC